MSSQSTLKRSLLPLPDGREIEVVILQRDDGTITVRTAEELELEQSREDRALPPEVP